LQAELGALSSGATAGRRSGSKSRDDEGVVATVPRAGSLRSGSDDEGVVATVPRAGSQRSGSDDEGVVATFGNI